MKLKKGCETIKIGNILDYSTVDYPEKLCSVLFLYSCNFACPFCFNKDLVTGDTYKEILIEDIIKKIGKNKEFVDAITITGGEPTIQEDLPILCKNLKNIGFLVKLDTNGSNPDVIKYILQNNLVDFIALDVKLPFDMYKSILNQNPPKEAYELIVNSSIDYECRTPVIEEFNSSQEILEKLSQDVCKAKTFVLEQFHPGNCLDNSFNSKKPFSREKMLELAKFFKNPIIKLRTSENGEEIVG